MYVAVATAEGELDATVTPAPELPPLPQLPMRGVRAIPPLKPTVWRSRHCRNTFQGCHQPTTSSEFLTTSSSCVLAPVFAGRRRTSLSSQRVRRCLGVAAGVGGLAVKGYPLCAVALAAATAFFH